MVKTKAQERDFLDELPDIEKIATDIRKIRRSAESLHQLGNRFPALSKNAGRILASLKMIELNVSGAAILLKSEIS